MSDPARFLLPRHAIMRRRDCFVAAAKSADAAMIEMRKVARCRKRGPGACLRSSRAVASRRLRRCAPYRKGNL